MLRAKQPSHADHCPPFRAEIKRVEVFSTAPACFKASMGTPYLYYEEEL
jgi:hypothetical protein